MSNTIEICFPIFLYFLLATETEQPHHDIESQNLEWGFNTDINSIFLTFSWLFGEFFKISWPISKFTDVFLTF